MNPAACAEHAETFWELFRSVPHWQFELFVSGLETLVINGLVLGLAWPFLKRHFQHHLIHDKAHQETTPTPGIAPFDPTYDARYRVRPVVKDGRLELEAREETPTERAETTFAEAPHAPMCRDRHPNCRADDPRVPNGGVCHCPNIRGVHDKRTSCPPPGIGRG